MDLTPYVARLQRDLVTTARTGGPEATELAELLAGGLEPSARMLLLDAVVEAAAEVTERLSPGSVDVRLRGRDLDLVVSSPASEPSAPATPAGSITTDATPASDADDDEAGGTARLSLRLPERLKPRVEEAAEAAGMSVNAWLVRTVSAAVADPRTTSAAPSTAPIRTGQRHTGWAR